MTQAKGTFTVKLIAQAADEGTEFIGRKTLDKQFAGDLEATSSGTMLAFMTETKGSAGYVAIEKISGQLDGKRGDFLVQHWGIMDRGEPEHRVSVIPDSGTGELTGLTGDMKIIIVDGLHSYEFDYTLP
jgi:hypothetical protein